jgi:hypothetical protein
MSEANSARESRKIILDCQHLADKLLIFVKVLKITQANSNPIF